MAIVKGEGQGDEFLWDKKYFEPRAGEVNPETGIPAGAEVTGGWKSRIEYLLNKK